MHRRERRGRRSDGLVARERRGVGRRAREGALVHGEGLRSRRDPRVPARLLAPRRRRRAAGPPLEGLAADEVGRQLDRRVRRRRHGAHERLRPSPPPRRLPHGEDVRRACRCAARRLAVRLRGARALVRQGGSGDRRERRQRQSVRAEARGALPVRAAGEQSAGRARGAGCEEARHAGVHDAAADPVARQGRPPGVHAPSVLRRLRLSDGREGIDPPQR